MLYLVNILECIYFESEGKVCLATARMGSYEPEESDIQTYCRAVGFQTCPRFEAMIKLKSTSNILRVKTVK